MSRIEQLLALQKDSPDDTFIAYALALEHAKSGDKELAIKAFENLMTHHPEYLGTYYQLGKLLEGENKREDARKVYTSGIEAAKAAGDQHTLSELMSANTNLDYA